MNMIINVSMSIMFKAIPILKVKNVISTIKNAANLALKTATFS